MFSEGKRCFMRFIEPHLFYGIGIVIGWSLSLWIGNIKGINRKGMESWSSVFRSSHILEISFSKNYIWLSLLTQKKKEIHRILVYLEFLLYYPKIDIRKLKVISENANSF